MSERNVEEDLKDTVKYAYELMAERDDLRVRLGVAEAIIEECKAYAEAEDNDDLRERLSWPDRQEPYDQSWRKKMYEQLEEEDDHE